jgi:glycosyltransferase involved in cell wall biosynthesis
MLFSQLPNQSYSILTSYYTEQHRKTGSWLPCDYYFIDHSPILLAAQNQNTHEQQNVPGVTQQQKPNRFIEVVKKVVRKIPPLLATIFGALAIRNTLRFYRAGKSILKQNPGQRVMGISDTGPALIAAYLLSRHLQRPLFFFLFDLYKGNYFEPPQNFLANRFESKMIHRAEKILVTNEGTAAYYAKRYPECTEKFQVTHNSVFPEDYAEQRTPYAPHPPYTILFTGHVYWAQEQSVLNLVQAMQQLQDLPVTLELYIPHPTESVRRAIEQAPNILLTSASPSEMPKIQSRATLLFLPLAWGTKSPDIIATATPGKFTGYLGSGRPMLVHAPDYAYVSQYARQHNLGLVVDENSTKRLALAIRTFLANPQLGQTYIANALAIFQQNHDARKNARKLTEILEMV